MRAYVYTGSPVCARPVAYIFFDARKRNPELEASRVFSVESSAKQFRQGMRFPRYLVYGYSLPRRDRLNQFQLPLYTLTRFRGRISKVCKATDLDFHGNLDALRLLHHPPSTFLSPRSLQTFRSFCNQQTALFNFTTASTIDPFILHPFL